LGFGLGIGEYKGHVETRNLYSINVGGGFDKLIVSFVVDALFFLEMMF
jgi:hypothetical protein